MMDDIFLTVSYSGGLYKVYALVRDGCNGPAVLCDIGSRYVAEHLAGTHEAPRKLFYTEARKLSQVIEANQAFLLGREGVATYLETQGDREEAQGLSPSLEEIEKSYLDKMDKRVE